MKKIGSFQRSPAPIVLVDNDRILFVSQEPSGEGKISEPVPLDSFLSEAASPDLLPKELFRRWASPVMVVPDYWVGSTSFRFPSQKKSMAEPFLERKLHEDLPDLPDAKHFFRYFFFRTARDEKMVHAYFLREPAFFRLFETLRQWNFEPHWMTTPAFLWQEKLKRKIPGFQQGGKAFVHMLSSDCFLYFFFEGNFFFSRQIPLSSMQAEGSDPLDTLTYEIRQSLYHFSQKTNAQINQIYVSSFGSVDAGEVSGRLGIEVIEFSELEEELAQEGVLIGLPGLLSGICLPDLSRPRAFLSLCDRRAKKEREWRPVQVAGAAIGFLLLLFLLGESHFLWRWSMPAGASQAQERRLSDSEAGRTIREYREALDVYLRESQRQSPGDGIVGLARSLPEKLEIREIIIETEPDPGLQLKGIVRASGPEDLGETLSSFLANLGKNFQGSRSLTIENIDLSEDQCGTEGGTRVCPIGLRFPLP